MIPTGSAPHIYAASIGIQDSIFLMLLALVVFGPRRLPEIGRQIGKLMYEFRKVSNDFKFQMEEELRTHEEAERQKKLQAALPPPAPAPVAETPVTMADTADAPHAQLAPEPTTEAATHLQVQPPSTGEQVAAARPFRAHTEPESVTPPATEATSEAQPGVSAETETHHG